ncbi:MAG: FGGY family carbohydrate kinase, partial [Phycisphaerales bacterium]
MSYLGIDIGTSGVKAVVFSETGQILSSAHQEYPTYSLQPGWFDLDPHEVVASSKAVISKVSAKVRNSDSVRSIGISSQGEAFTVLDKDDKFLCNAMVSFDTRSQKQVCEFTEIFGAERLYNITGHSAHTIFSVFKILWLKENQPQLFARIKRLLCFGDLLGYELTGKAAISYNLAGRTMLFDVRMLEWSDEILYAIGLDKSALSEALPAGYPIGNLKKDIAGELGLGSDVIVTTGGHDQSCGAVGVGAASSG